VRKADAPKRRRTAAEGPDPSIYTSDSASGATAGLRFTGIGEVADVILIVTA
jgi:hypothetical protein